MVLAKHQAYDLDDLHQHSRTICATEGAHLPVAFDRFSNPEDRRIPCLELEQH